jgi:CheY-like chemotaxis protein
MTYFRHTLDSPLRSPAETHSLSRTNCAAAISYCGQDFHEVLTIALNHTTGKRILIVEDNVDAASTLRQALEEMGHVVAVADNGLAALEAARRFCPEVALLDISLPVMDGYELAKRLRDEVSPHLRLIALTGHGLDRYRVRSAVAGFDAHIVKPVDIQQLVRICCQQEV